MNWVLFVLRILLGFHAESGPRLQPVVVHRDGRTSLAALRPQMFWNGSVGGGWLTPRMALNRPRAQCDCAPWAPDHRTNAGSSRTGPCHDGGGDRQA